MIGSWVVVATALAIAVASPKCSQTFTIDGVPFTYDWSSLKSATNYAATDNAGHDYMFNVCADVATPCLPETWTNTLEYGAAIQLWGVAPACNASDPSTLKCVDKVTGSAVCCTRDCQVLGTGVGTAELLDASKPGAGIRLHFAGAVPAADDPFWCPWNPETGSQYPRTVTYDMLCDPQVDGIKVLDASQNSSQDCAYTIKMASAVTCPSGIPPTPLGPTWVGTVDNKEYVFNLSSMCSNVDYVVNDTSGHMFAASVCAYANQPCFPQKWNPTHSRGVVVELFGETPPCNRSDPSTMCVDPVTKERVCCTANCHVLGTGGPTFQFLNPMLPDAGVRLSFATVHVAEDSPYWCPWDPARNDQFPLSVQFDVVCAMTNGNTTVAQSAGTTAPSYCSRVIQFESPAGCPVQRPVTSSKHLRA